MTLSAERSHKLGSWTKEIHPDNDLNVMEDPLQEELNLLDTLPAAQTHLELLDEDLVLDEVKDNV